MSVVFSNSGLERTITTESAVTSVPGRIRMRSMRPSVRAVISIVSSGTSVPSPRTSRSMGPRFTASGQRVDISTPGAAGLSFASPIVMAGIVAKTNTPDQDPDDELLLLRVLAWDIHCNFRD